MVATANAPSEIVRKGLKADGVLKSDEPHPHSSPERGHIEVSQTLQPFTHIIRIPNRQLDSDPTHLRPH